MKKAAIPDWQREILKERLEDLDRNPDDEEPWEKVKAELWPIPEGERRSKLRLNERRQQAKEP